MPDKVKQALHKSLAVSRTSHDMHYQGGDAALEEINKAAKTTLVGVPTSKQWQKSFRDLDYLYDIVIQQ